MRLALDYVRRHAVAFGALFVALGGGAIAAIPDSGGVIHACYKSNGDLRVVDSSSGKTCKANETALDWNQRGPKGEPGPQAPPGSGGVVARARSTAAVTAGACSSYTPVPLSNAAWTQAANESDQVFGQITWVHDSSTSGNTGGSVQVRVRINGVPLGVPVSVGIGSGPLGETRTDTFTVTKANLGTAVRFEPGSASQNVLTAEVCNGEPPSTPSNVTQTVKELRLNVVGVR